MVFKSDSYKKKSSCSNNGKKRANPTIFMALKTKSTPSQSFPFTTRGYTETMGMVSIKSLCLTLISMPDGVDYQPLEDTL
jgi:hypothetical protein